MMTKPDRAKRFHGMLVQDGIPKANRYDNKKWLRYYLDSCQKYHHPDGEKEGLPHFIW